MAVTVYVMTNFIEQVGQKQIDLDTDTFKIALYSVALASVDGNPVYSTTNEYSGSGYTAGGATLSTLSWTQDDTNNWMKWDADDVTWTNLAAGTVAAARIYWNGATKHVCVEWTGLDNPDGGDYTLALAANGIATWKQA
jgi:hypothetical protein